MRLLAAVGFGIALAGCAVAPSGTGADGAAEDVLVFDRGGSRSPAARALSLLDKPPVHRPPPCVDRDMEVWLDDESRMPQSSDLSPSGQSAVREWLFRERALCKAGVNPSEIDRTYSSRVEDAARRFPGGSALAPNAFDLGAANERPDPERPRAIGD
ncbi:MAG: hypothetical protein AAGC56_03435 [Pseudomonadota bacterium]